MTARVARPTLRGSSIRGDSPQLVEDVEDHRNVILPASGDRRSRRKRELLAIRVYVEWAECLLTPPDELSRNDLEVFVADVVQAAPKADALVLAFASTRTLEMIVPLEKRWNVPVVSARPHAFWASVRLLGLEGTVPALGTVLSKG